MALKSVGILVTLTAFASVGVTTACTPPPSTESAPWRTSFEAFLKAVDVFPMDDLPFAKVEVGESVGKRVDGDEPIMRAFGGRVEFDGIFQGFFTVDDPTKPGAKKEKIDMAMVWPSGLSPSTDWKLHLYAKRSARKSWRALPPGTAVKFRGDVTGITLHYPWIPGLHLRTLAILVEDAEIVKSANR